MITLVKKLKKQILPIGQKRGRVSTITLSVNSFVPKPWTPFQYESFGGSHFALPNNEKNSKQGVLALKQKIKYLRKGLAKEANVRIKTDRPEMVLQQAIFSRGDRRLAPLLLDMASKGLSLKQALKKHNLSSWEYAGRTREKDETFCWDILDHGINKSYLWQEYQKAMTEKITIPCDTVKCRRCGVCNEKTTD